jgi:hypothetical protein
MNFGLALECLKKGQRVTSGRWPKGVYLRFVPGDSVRTSSGKTQYRLLPYIQITTVDGDRVPWTVNQTDLLAEDWVVVE